MKITNAKSAAAAWVAGERKEVAWWCWGKKWRYVRTFLDGREAAPRLAAVALELMDLRSIPGYSGRMETTRSFLRMMAWDDEGAES